MANDNRGPITQQGNYLRINNALVEDVSQTTRNTGSIIVSYSVPAPNGRTAIEQLQLNVNNNTFIQGQFGLPLCFCELRQGMWIDVTFSSAMTRSIPPQSNAFMIIVRRMPQTFPPQTLPPQVLPPQILPPQILPPQVLPPQNCPTQNCPPQNRPQPTSTTTGRIARVDASNNLLYTGTPGNIGSQTRFVVTSSTLIQNRNGFPILLRALRPGQLVRITHANFMTASIPPQTTAFRIQVL